MWGYFTSYEPSNETRSDSWLVEDKSTIRFYISLSRLQTPTVAVPAVLESGGVVVVKDARCARVRGGRRRDKCGAHAHRRCDYYQRKGCYSIVLVLFMTLFVGARAQCTAVTSNSVGALRNALIPTTGSASYDKYMNGLQSNSASHTTSVAEIATARIVTPNQYVQTVSSNPTRFLSHTTRYIIQIIPYSVRHE